MSLTVSQGGGLFRSGTNGDVNNIFFENNAAALSGGGLFEASAPALHQQLHHPSTAAGRDPELIAMRHAVCVYARRWILAVHRPYR